MSRLKNALDDLNRKGYIFSSVKQISGGINSAVFQLKGSNAINYALKIYPLASSNDPRNRCLTERNFLSYLGLCQVCNTPSLLETNISAAWSLFCWLEGRKPKTLQSRDFRDIAAFVGSINPASVVIARSQLQPASEACCSLTGLIESISERINRLLLTNSNSEVSIRALQWIANTIKPRFQLISKNLLVSHVDSSHWHSLESCRIASPSDVGIHNTLKTPQGLQFLDFEYAGLDDLSKLAADWILQPEYCLNERQEDILIGYLLAQTQGLIGDSWISRLADIKPLLHIKWCLIMLNKLPSNHLEVSQLAKAMSYFAEPYC